MNICSYPPCNKVAVTAFPMETGTGHLCAEHAARTDMVALRLATMTQDEVYAYIDGLIDAQVGMTAADKEILREYLRTKYATGEQS